MKLINRVLTPNSILKEKEKYIPITIGKRPRLATCTAVCWLNENIIASLNLYGNTIETYYYDADKNEFTLLQQITNGIGARLSMSEHLSVSPCGKLLAVCSAPPLSEPTPKACVHIYRISDGSINPIPVFTVEEDQLIHSVRFSSNGKYLAYATYQDERAIIFCHITDTQSTFKLMPYQIIFNNFSPKKPKTINFTKDGRYALVAYCIGLVNFQGPISSCLVCYKLNDKGEIINQVCCFDHDMGMEDIVFSKDENYFFVSDQVNDYVLKFAFNVGKIQYIDKFNPSESINFPHGMSISKDGKLLAVANYGKDEFTLYEL